MKEKHKPSLEEFMKAEGTMTEQEKKLSHDRLCSLEREKSLSESFELVFDNLHYVYEFGLSAEAKAANRKFEWIGSLYNRIIGEAKGIINNSPSNKIAAIGAGNPARYDLGRLEILSGAVYPLLNCLDSQNTKEAKETMDEIINAFEAANDTLDYAHYTDFSREEIDATWEDVRKEAKRVKELPY